MADLTITQSTSRSGSPPDLPTVCSEYDHGGGVLSISDSSSTNTFIIYTTTILPPSIQALLNDPPPDLRSLASTVAERIPIHLTTSTLTGKLHAAPPDSHNPHSGRRSTETNRLPAFFVNSARSSKHAIAGRRSVLETLLYVLQRPWCVLELCCVPAVEGVRALLEFTRCAAGLGLWGYRYRAAEMLFAHELRSRRDQVDEEEEQKHEQGQELGRRTWTRTQNDVAKRRRPSCPPAISAARIVPMGQSRSFTRKSLDNDLREMYMAIFGGSMGSYHGFWLRLLCIVSPELGVGYSQLGALLSGGDRRNIELKKGCSRRVRSISSPSNDEDNMRRAACGRRRSTSLIECSARFEGVLDGARGGGDRDEWLDEETEPKEFLVSVYTEVLGRLSDAEMYTVTTIRSGARLPFVGEI